MMFGEVTLDAKYADSREWSRGLIPRCSLGSGLCWAGLGSACLGAELLGAERGGAGRSHGPSQSHGPGSPLASHYTALVLRAIFAFKMLNTSSFHRRADAALPCTGAMDASPPLGAQARRREDRQKVRLPSVSKQLELRRPPPLRALLDPRLFSHQVATKS